MSQPCPTCDSETCSFAKGWSWRCPEAPIEVLGERFEQFRLAFEKLVRKAAKLGVASPSYRELGSFTRIELVTDADGMLKRPYRYRAKGLIRPVKVEGVAPRFAGWSLVAVLEPIELSTGEVANVISGVPGAGDIPEIYRTRGPYCDHCKTTRNRKETFVVRHDDGRYVQVGRDCVSDFLGGVSPAELASLFSFFRDTVTSDDDEEGGWSKGGADVLSLPEFLGLVVREVRANGWLSRKAARESYEPKRATADLVWERAFPSPLSGRKRETADEDEMVLARGAVVWALSLDGRTDLSDYEHNVLVRAKAGYVDSKAAGIAASIWIAFEKSKAREIERRERRERFASIRGSRFQGTEGEKIERFLTVQRIYDIQTDFGASYLHLFQDSAGNAYKWFASSERLTPGEMYRVSGTVKRHERRALGKDEGAPEIETTVLTRCAASDPYVGVVKVGKAAIKLVDPGSCGLARLVKSAHVEYRDVPTTEERLDWQGKIDYVRSPVDIVEWSADTFEGSREALEAFKARLLAAGKAGVKAAEKIEGTIACVLPRPEVATDAQ